MDEQTKITIEAARKLADKIDTGEASASVSSGFLRMWADEQEHIATVLGRRRDTLDEILRSFG